MTEMKIKSYMHLHRSLSMATAEACVQMFMCGACGRVGHFMLLLGDNGLVTHRNVQTLNRDKSDIALRYVAKGGLGEACVNVSPEQQHRQAYWPIL